MQPRVVDVERVKKAARKLAAGQVLAGGVADVCLDMAELEGCKVRIAAGYGPLSESPEPVTVDTLLWILDGYSEVLDPTGTTSHVRQGESVVLKGGSAYRLVFPQLSIYLRVKPGGASE